MSNTSRTLMNYFHSMIGYFVNQAMHSVEGPETTQTDLLGGNLTTEDINTLRTIVLYKDQQQALRKLLVSVCRVTTADFLGVIDGIAMSEQFELPELSLVDRNSLKDIAEDTLLNEEFYQLLEDQE